MLCFYFRHVFEQYSPNDVELDTVQVAADVNTRWRLHFKHAQIQKLQQQSKTKKTKKKDFSDRPTL